MPALLLAAIILAGPTKPLTQEDRLAAYILEVNPRATYDTGELARRIIFEAQAHRLDVALFAAIGYIESRFRLYPHGGGPRTHQAALWQVYPDETWLLVPRPQRMELSRNLTWSTWRAATILAHLIGRSPHTPATYCRYNRRPCRRSYIVALYRQAKRIRAVLGKSPSRSPTTW